MEKNIKLQPQNIRQNFDEKYMTLIGSLNSYGFDSDLFFNIMDFTKKIALVPCSARTKEGISELIMMLCGLRQKYLVERLELKKDANPEVVLNQLYTHSRLQETFSINLLALVDNRPRLLSLKEILHQFIFHRSVFLKTP